MNHSRALLFAFVPGAFACLGFVSSQRGAIERVRWMTGCWEAVNAQRTVYEQWTTSQGRTMLGTGRTVRRDSLIEYEFVVLREQGEGLAYEAHPSGQAGATFQSTSITDSSVTFENLANDFPKRVGYNRRGTDSLVAWISGPRGGTTRRIDFPYRRVRCDPGV
jgi:hypothetical protein